MEAYYENQVELANKGREDFKHHGDNATVETVLKSKENAEYRDNSYTDENRPKLYEVISTEDVSFDE
jgi:hypothetical protein